MTPKEIKVAANAQVTRRHALFVDMVRRRLAEQGDGGLVKRGSASSARSSSSLSSMPRVPSRSADLPVFSPDTCY